MLVDKSNVPSLRHIETTNTNTNTNIITDNKTQTTELEHTTDTPPTQPMQPYSSVKEGSLYIDLKRPFNENIKKWEYNKKKYLIM